MLSFKFCIFFYRLLIGGGRRAAYQKRKGERRNAYRNSSWAPECKGLRERSRRRLEGNIDVCVIGDIDWVHVAAVMNLLFFPYKMRDFLTSWASVSIAVRHLHQCISICL